MGGKMNWDRVSQERRLAYVPKPGALPATQKQLGYIGGLCREKGKPVPARLPRTKRGASEMIEHLLEFPDVPEVQRAEYIELVAERPELPINLNQEMVIQLRETFPELSPMQGHSIINLFASIDAVGVAFLVDSLSREDHPSTPDAIILSLTRRFLEEFAASADVS